MNRLVAHIRLLRPLNLFTSALAVLLSSLIVHYRGPVEITILVTFVVISFNENMHSIIGF